MQAVSMVLKGLIRAYQLTFSYWLGRECRFLPTCSAYAIEAIDTHGAWVGGRLAWRRFCKCHPFSSHYGYDPVPTRPEERLDSRVFRAINPRSDKEYLQ